MAGFDPNQQLGVMRRPPPTPASPSPVTAPTAPQATTVTQPAQPTSPDFFQSVANHSVGAIRNAADRLQPLTDAYQQGGAWGVVKQATHGVADVNRSLMGNVVAPAAAVGAKVLMGPDAAQKTQQFLTPSAQQQSDVQSQPKPPVSTSPDRSAAQIQPDINNVQKGYGVARFEGGPSYSVTPEGVTRGDGKALGGTLSFMPDDKTAESAGKIADHAQGMARLRAGLPYDAAEAAAVQQRQSAAPAYTPDTPSQWELHTAAVNASRGANRQADQVELAQLLKRADPERIDKVALAQEGFGVQREKNAADLAAARSSSAVAQSNADRTYQLGVMNALKPTTGGTTLEVPMIGADGRPVTNRETGEPFTRDVHASTVNGQVQEDPALLSQALNDSELIGKANVDDSRSWFDNLWSSATPAQYAQAKADAFNKRAAQYGINKQMVILPDGTPAWQ